MNCIGVIGLGSISNRHRQNIRKHFNNAKIIVAPSNPLPIRKNIQNYDIYESDLAKADEIWCSSSTNAVVPIVKLDDNIIKDGKVGPVSTEVYTIAQDFIVNF